ncbi:RlmE family RNA methyltransferase [Methyloceanibacter sp.]|uniref:RlmE family RNA methyltransferase n=1 Tax=Methyloceanibacter sp. TaxID=1965321 RepID=UPI002D51C438|nr:RlmE family RNA methyltransferase [Methyloceanibacter sp.]HZP10065.1 RlmE family RNA methyltransferase [Methyloceanibacter sp.]
MRTKGRSRAGSGGTRRLAVRVKTAKGRKLASTRWLQRQLNDPYVEEAKRRGYRSRAAFKLAEIDDKYQLLRPGLCVVDLGAAPGGWSQIAAQRVGLMAGKGRVVAVDIAEMEPISGVTLLHLDMTDPEAADHIRAALEGKQADLVLSDMHAPATGHKQTDHLRIMSLVEAALDLAETILAPGGAFLCKVLQGGASKDLVARLNRAFAKVRHVKPKASRAESSEMYVLATGFRGASE